MAKDYRQALTMYERVIQSGWGTADYAIYQKGIIAGAQNKNKEKSFFVLRIHRAHAEVTRAPPGPIS
jgi:hypothetical protein